jgi:type 1 glutamine amidotransferase
MSNLLSCISLRFLRCFVASSAVCSRVSDFEFRLSFGFWISSFGFPLAACCVSFLTALALPALGAESFVKNSDERARIEQALPRKAPVQATKPRRLLIFTLNVGYGGHPSIAYANEAFSLMGRQTGAFEATVSGNPTVFRRETLCQFDAVFFNNTVGNCFTNAELRRDLLEFITAGGGLLGVHGTSVAFTRWPGAVEDWPEFGRIIGARGASHKESNEHVYIKLDDPEHPLNRVFGSQGFEYRDEFFRVHEPYSRERVRVLFSIDTARTDVNQGQPRGDCLRTDNDYALAWVRNYGRGRVCYCTIAHNPYVFWDPKMLEFYLAALQFVLGDLPAPTIPSAKLTPATRAQEKLGWRLGLEACATNKPAFFEAVDKSRDLRLLCIGASSSQIVSRDTPKNLDPQLTDGEL